MSEALNVQRAFNVSLVVFFVAIFLGVVVALGYLYFQERKYSKREGRHTITQDNLPVVNDDVLVSPLEEDHMPKDSESTGKHRALVAEVPDYMPAFHPAPSTSDIGRIVKDIQANGKHHAPDSGVATTVVDMGIPCETLQYDIPTTRLSFLKATDDDTDYFKKIKDMVDGIQ